MAGLEPKCRTKMLRRLYSCADLQVGTCCELWPTPAHAGEIAIAKVNWLLAGGNYDAARCRSVMSTVSTVDVETANPTACDLLD